MTLRDLREALAARKEGKVFLASDDGGLYDPVYRVAYLIAELLETCPDPEGNGPAACWRCNGLGVVASDLGRATSTTAGLAHLAEYLFGGSHD